MHVIARKVYRKLTRAIETTTDLPMFSFVFIFNAEKIGNRLIVKLKATSMKHIDLITLNTSVSSLGFYISLKLILSPFVNVSVPNRHS